MSCNLCIRVKAIRNGFLTRFCHILTIRFSEIRQQIRVTRELLAQTALKTILLKKQINITHAVLEFCTGALLSTVLWVLTTVLRNKTKRAENWANPGKQHGCHNFYRQGVLLLYGIMLTKPFLIALTLIHKLQDIFTFVPVSAILCCFNPFRSNYG